MNTTSISPKTYTINSGKGTYVGPAYTVFKAGAKAFGFYKDIRPYLPEELIQQARTKAIKSVKYKYSTTLAGNAFQTSRFKRIQKSSKLATCGFNKKCQVP